LERVGDNEVRLRRRCTSICEVTGLEGGRVAMTELWGLDPDGTLVPKHALSSVRRERMEISGAWRWQTNGWVPTGLAPPSMNGHR
jgi:hypothetical protein